MFGSRTYQERRRALRLAFTNGLLLFPGACEAPMNYAANWYPFRQDSSFLYFWGLSEPGLFALIDVDSGAEILFGDEPTLDDEIWMGSRPSLTERAAQIGVATIKPRAELALVLGTAIRERRRLHFLPQHRAENRLFLEDLLGIRAESVGAHASPELIKAIVSLRSKKTDEEVAEIEKALSISSEMYRMALERTKPGIVEQEIVGAVEGLASARGARTSFPTIFSIHGETLHNHEHSVKMEDGQLVLFDSGIESPRYYASDVTRTFPVSGRFDERQKRVYEIVLTAQEKAISLMKPGVFFRDIHLESALVIAEGLVRLGLLRGDPRDLVESGAHALFYPHGLGHMLGLDVHDMEGLGEQFVGYDAEIQRSKQFGLAFLRMARRLEPGHVVTVEPGIYFIPALIRAWKTEKRFSGQVD